MTGIRGFNFQTVRIYSRSCGWQRILGLTGIKNEERAIIRIRPCEHPHVLLSARTKIIPVSVSQVECELLYPGYRDLESEAHMHGLTAMLKEYEWYLSNKGCPRCRSIGGLVLDMIGYPYNQVVRY
jgi:hypothetical protein